MFIDTHSQNTIIESLCKVLRITTVKLEEELNKIEQINNKDQFIDAFISEKVHTYPDEILLFHLSRRLNGTENDKNGQNLFVLLTTPNPLSELMKRFGIEFFDCEGHIETLYMGKPVDWDKCYNGNSSYMKWRLGFFEKQKDYCFNGFAFKDLLYKNTYARSLLNMPEFLSQLIACLGCVKLEKYYIENSTYYCYEYKLPMKLILFDDNEALPTDQKPHYLMKRIFQRLLKYKETNVRFMLDDDNPVLRLEDNYVVPSDYFVNKEIVVSDMLF